MTAHPIRRAVAVLAAAALTVTLAVTALAAEVEAAKPKPKCQGKTATIVGTKQADIIRGTNKRDVIVAKGGNDRIYGRGGNDIICAGGGNDRVLGGRGIDRLWGQTGHDKLYGNAGPDFLAGQIGNDTLVGGIGVDTCFQGTGSGPVARCERPAPPPPPGPSLIPLDGILAVAYSDIDGLDGYSTGDVLISRVVDLDGNGPDAGDTIEMGRYPLNLNATAFGDWLDKSHVVASISNQNADVLALLSTDGGLHLWAQGGIPVLYSEGVGANGSTFEDSYVATAFPDVVRAATSSPSAPQTAVPSTTTFRATDDPFLDVDLNY